MKSAAALLLGALSIFSMIFLNACNEKKPSFEQITKLDAHVHIRTSDPLIVETAKNNNFKLLTIAVRSDSRKNIDDQLTYALDWQKKYPEDIFVATTFSMENFETPGWQDGVMSQLANDFESGAMSVKVWKDIGMTFRDSLDQFIMIDDPRFDPVLDFIAQRDKTLIAHIGEPRNCWLPLDSMTVNNDRSYFEEHPQYHMYLHPDYPSYEEQIRSRDRMLEKHPDLKVVGAHLGSLEWDVDELAKRLDKYPNFAVDMAARICHLQVQKTEKVRAFIVKYQDRLLYGTDFGVRDGNDMEQQKLRMLETWMDDWNYFSTDALLESPNVNNKFEGLDLPETVLRKIYYENAVEWFGI